MVKVVVVTSGGGRSQVRRSAYFGSQDAQQRFPERIETVISVWIIVRLFQTNGAVGQDNRSVTRFNLCAAGSLAIGAIRILLVAGMSKSKVMAQLVSP